MDDARQVNPFLVVTRGTLLQLKRKPGGRIRAGANYRAVATVAAVID